eukprot:434035-Prymnesium_polylepis.1
MRAARRASGTFRAGVQPIASGIASGEPKQQPAARAHCARSSQRAKTTRAASSTLGCTAW